MGIPVSGPPGGPPIGDVPDVEGSPSTAAAPQGLTDSVSTSGGITTGSTYDAQFPVIAKVLSDLSSNNPEADSKQIEAALRDLQMLNFNSALKQQITDSLSRRLAQMKSGVSPEEILANEDPQFLNMIRPLVSKLAKELAEKWAAAEEKEGEVKKSDLANKFLSGTAETAIAIAFMLLAVVLRDIGFSSKMTSIALRQSEMEFLKAEMEEIYAIGAREAEMYKKLATLTLIGAWTGLVINVVGGLATMRMSKGGATDGSQHVAAQNKAAMGVANKGVSDFASGMVEWQKLLEQSDEKLYVAQREAKKEFIKAMKETMAAAKQNELEYANKSAQAMDQLFSAKDNIISQMYRSGWKNA